MIYGLWALIIVIGLADLIINIRNYKTAEKILSKQEYNYGILYGELMGIKTSPGCSHDPGEPVLIPSMWDDPAWIESVRTDVDNTVSSKWGLEPHAFGRIIFTDPQLARYSGGLKTLYLKQFIREMVKHFEDRIEVYESTKDENPDYLQDVDPLKDTIYRIKRFYNQHPWRANRHSDKDVWGD